MHNYIYKHYYISSYISYFFFFSFWTTPRNTKVLLIKEFSVLRDYSWKLQETIWGSGDQTLIGCLQGKCPNTFAITPASILIYFNCPVYLISSSIKYHHNCWNRLFIDFLCFISLQNNLYNISMVKAAK